MPDNLTLNAGAGGSTLATDDVVGVHYQIEKLAFGALDSATLAAAGAGVVTAGVQRTTLASDDPAVAGITTIAGAVAGTEMQVDVLTMPTVTVNSHAVTNAGTFAVQADTELTLGDMDTGVGTDNRAVVGLVRAESGGGVLVGSANPLPVSGPVTNAGTFAVQESGGALTALQLIDNIVSGAGANISQIGGAAAPIGAGLEATAVRVTLPTDGTGKVTAVSGTAANMKVEATLAAAQTLATLTTITNVVHVDDNAGSLTVDGSVTAGGAAAHDAAVSGNPTRLAGRALTADYTAVATGDTADIITSILGKQVILPFSIPDNTWSYPAASGGIVNTTGISMKAAAGAGIRIYLTHIDVVNGHATVDTDVQVRDGAAGTVLHRGFAKAAGGGYSVDFVPPLRGTANTLLEIACGTTGSAVYVNATGYVGAE